MYQPGSCTYIICKCAYRQAKGHYTRHRNALIHERALYPASRLRIIAFLLNMNVVCGAVAQTVALVNVDHGRLDFFVAGV